MNYEISVITVTASSNLAQCVTFLTVPRTAHSFTFQPDLLTIVALLLQFDTCEILGGTAVFTSLHREFFVS
jgi:hypothetical protein